MIQVNPLSLTLKPVPRAYTAKDYPLKRGFNAVQYFELSGSALLTQAEKDALDQQYHWDSLAVLDVLGLSNYVARNKTQPKHALVDCHLYNSTFEFELKPLDSSSVGTTGKTGYLEVTAAGDVLYHAEAGAGLTFSLSGDDLIASIAPSSLDYAMRTGDAVQRVVVDDAPVKAFFVIDAAGNLLYRPDLAWDMQVALVGDDLVVSHSTDVPNNLQRDGDKIVWYPGGVPIAQGFAGMPSPPLDGFSENRVEFRTAQQFSSGRIRQVGKRLGYLRDVSYSQSLTPSDAARFVTFYREYDHEPLTADWITAYFGTGRKLVFGQQPWELKATGSRFELSVQGYVI